MRWNPSFCAHRGWRNSGFHHQEVQRYLCDYREDGFPRTTRLHEILFQVRENCYRMLWNVEVSFWGTKTQASQWKSPGSPWPKKAGMWEAVSSQCWFVSLIRRELFTYNFFLVKQLMLHSTSKFWNVYGIMCEGSDLISGGQHMAAPPWQCASPCCPLDSTVFDGKQHDCGATSSLLSRPYTQRLFLLSKSENEA